MGKGKGEESGEWEREWGREGEGKERGKFHHGFEGMGAPSAIEQMTARNVVHMAAP